MCQTGEFPAVIGERLSILLDFEAQARDSRQCVIPAVTSHRIVRLRQSPVKTTIPCEREMGALFNGRSEIVDQNEIVRRGQRSEEHTSELQSLMRISYAVFCLKKQKQNTMR